MFFTLLVSFWLLGPLAPEPPSYTKAELLGDVVPARHPDFSQVHRRFTNREDAYLRMEVYDAFRQMWEAAQKEGINLVIISAARNRAYQKGIWNRKWLTYGGPDSTRAERILQYSSMPGTSRHHWGTDFDLNALENSYFEAGEGARIYRWLCDNAHQYGFFQPYTAFNAYRDAGYREEKWHWSYYPLAQRFQRAYNHVVNYEDLTGFTGSEYARPLDVINDYVNGVAAPEP